jgi:hypothetical protein
MAAHDESVASRGERSRGIVRNCGRGGESSRGSQLRKGCCGEEMRKVKGNHVPRFLFLCFHSHRLRCFRYTHLPTLYSKALVLHAF